MVQQPLFLIDGFFRSDILIIKISDYYRLMKMYEHCKYQSKMQFLVTWLIDF